MVKIQIKMTHLIQSQVDIPGQRQQPTQNRLKVKGSFQPTLPRTVNNLSQRSHETCLVPGDGVKFTRTLRIICSHNLYLLTLRFCTRKKMKVEYPISNKLNLTKFNLTWEKARSKTTTLVSIELGS